MAARLSEKQDWNVLLVEAGPDEPPGTQIPSNLQLFLSNASFHSCVSQDFCDYPQLTLIVMQHCRYIIGLELQNFERILRLSD